MTNDPLAHRIATGIPSLGSLYHRLMLVVGPPRTGKTQALRALAVGHDWPLVNVSLSLSEQLLELPPSRRAVNAPKLLHDLVDDRSGEVLLLDNTEVLFSTGLELDPLHLLQAVSRHRATVSSWAGLYDGKRLTYGDASHPEFRRYDHPDAVIVTALDGQSPTLPATDPGSP